MRRKLIRLSLIAFTAVIILLTGLFFSPSFLNFRHPIKSHVLIIEAWIAPYEVEQAIPLIHSDSVTRVMVVGQTYPDDGDSLLSAPQKHFNKSQPTLEDMKDGIWLFTNSSLAFALKDIPFTDLSGDSLAIGIRAKGSEAAGYFAHFNLIVNGKYCGGAFTSAVDSVFTFPVDLPKEDLQSIIIHFDNDLVHRNRDRNLNILSLKVGETEINASDQNTILIKNAGKFSNGFESEAAEMKNYLVQLGILSCKVNNISFTPVRRNQTLAAAHAFKSSPSSREISSANVVSSGLHSRRTWLTYKRVLGKDTEVGVINFEQSDYRKGTREDNILQFQHLIDEAFSYLFNWIYLTFGGG